MSYSIITRKGKKYLAIELGEGGFQSGPNPRRLEGWLPIVASLGIEPLEGNIKDQRAYHGKHSAQVEGEILSIRGDKTAELLGLELEGRSDAGGWIRLNPLRVPFALQKIFLIANNRILYLKQALEREKIGPAREPSKKSVVLLSREEWEEIVAEEKRQRFLMGEEE